MNKSKPFLSQSDLNSQVRRMVAFIEHEAKERAEEIDLKAEGEYCYEKGRLMHSARQDFSRVYEKKEKLVIKQAQINAATLGNQARLRELACREAHIARVEAEVQNRLLKRNENIGLYTSTLQDMLIQGLLKLLERSVWVRVREQDVKLIEKLLEPATQRYQEAVGRKLKLQVDTSKYLPPSSLGGVELANASRKVRVNNTFHSRLEMIVRQLVPQIRKQLFDSPERKK